MAAVQSRGIAWATLTCSLGSALVARAGDGVEPFRVHYRAVAGCPTESEFVENVLARTPLARLAARGERARTFVVTLHSAEQGVVGSLAVEDESEATETRELVAESCEQAVRALSLVVALAIDPHAREPSRAAYPAPPPATPEPSAAPAPSTVPPLPPPSVPAERRSASSAPLASMVGLRLELDTGMAPGILPVPTAFFGVLLDHERIWMAASLGGGFKGFQVKPALARVEFLYVGGRLDFCAGAARGAFWIGPCVAVAAGGVRAGARRGNLSALVSTRGQTEPWVAPSFGARAAWRPLGFLEFDLLGGVGFPLVHSHYYFSAPPGAANQPIYDVPSAAPFVGLGAGIRLP